MIELKNLCKSYGELEILKNVNAVINDGEIVAIIGHSGAGKSTLLHMVNVLEPATSGQVVFNGIDLMDPSTDIKMYRRKIGMVFQQFNLFGHMTVLENVMIPQIDLLKRDRQEACDHAMEYLRLVGMADRIWHYPHELSGGQKQRAAIARTLAMDPEVLLLDEPTSALDQAMVGEVEYVLKKLTEMNKTIILVTHELRLAKEMSTRVFYLDEKGIYEDAPTGVIFTEPKREKTKRFIKKLKCLEIDIRSADFDYVDAVNLIQQFCERQEFTADRTQKVQLLFEEFFIINLIPHVMPGGFIRAIFEYDAEVDSIRLEARHTATMLFEEMEEKDPLSGMIIGTLMEEINLIEDKIDEEEIPRD